MARPSVPRLRGAEVGAPAGCYAFEQALLLRLSTGTTATSGGGGSGGGWVSVLQASAVVHVPMR